MAGELEQGGNPLATWVVQISAEGAEALDAVLAQTKARLDAVEVGAKSVAGNINQVMTSAAGKARRAVESIPTRPQKTAAAQSESARKGPSRPIVSAAEV